MTLYRRAFMKCFLNSALLILIDPSTVLTAQVTDETMPSAEKHQANEESITGSPAFTAALKLYEHNLAGRIGRGFEYDFQRVEQPNVLINGSGSLVTNPEHYLNEHTLKFQFSEVFPSTSTLASAFKNACALASAAPQCKDTRWLGLIAGGGGTWKRVLAGLTLTGDLSERAASQQGIIVTNPPFANHYQVTGGVDFDPTQLFITGANWSKAVDAINSDVCDGKQEVNCVRELSRVRLKSSHNSPHRSATEFLAATVPTISFKRVSQFDFVKNGGILIPSPYLEKAQNQLTFKWDLKKTIVPPSAIADPGIATKKSTATRLCILVSGNASSVIMVKDSFPASSCARFAASEAAEYKLACEGKEEIREGPKRKAADLGTNLDPVAEGCWH